ncbi:hypothetical protein [Nocardioides flavescens]|uniref:Uncharacterized protein n=1 Tax=Nocardioides flavescens TaxID=2691959 RepID=A0A6L7EXU7_9ACTN|nr:hypothetical protein [Nocardioides flavescens]MXG88531.1 hypothetical protein [Nocardioides flavescens]
MSRRRVEEVALVAWSVLLAAVTLGPALAPGALELRDMVWVPDLRLSGDALGFGSGLPRAVPSDAVVAVLDEAVRGELLQRLVLFCGLAGGGLGVARLLGPAAATVARFAAVTLYVWNAWVLERLLMGQWPVLVGCAVLPWVVLGTRDWAGRRRLSPFLLVLLPLGSLSASAGLVTAVGLLLSLHDAGRRRLGGALLLVVAANAPWIASGLLHAADATSDPRAAEVFALHREGGVPAPLAALTLGGIWNADVVPLERTGLLGWAALVVLCGLAAAGAGVWWRRTSSPLRTALVGCWCVGAGLALLTWAAPGVVGWAAAHVPGAGVIRDGARPLVLCAPLLAVLVGSGVELVLRRLQGPPRVVLAVAAVLLPVALLPSLAWGAGGSLRPTTLPAAYAEARDLLADGQGDVLLLPLSSYRAPVWNGGRPVLDPLARYLARDPGSSVVASDVLVVDGVPLAGEDPRVASAAGALAATSPELRARGLAAIGIGAVVTDLAAPGAERAPAVAGDVLLDGTGPSEGLRVVSLHHVQVREVPIAWVVVMGLAWVLFLALPVGSVALVAVRRGAWWRGRRPPRRGVRERPRDV